MPTQEELEAITCMCVRVIQLLKYGEDKVNKEKLYKEEQIVWNYAQKVIKKKEECRVYAREHMREMRKTNPDYCHYYVKKGRKARHKRGENYKKYQHEYYLRVTKPKRQAKKKGE